MKPSAQARHDTTRVQVAESTQSAATPTPAPTPQQQDTAKATQGAGTTSGGGDTSSDQPLRDAYHQAPKDTVSQAVYDGWKQFNLNCARCHGEDVLGTTIAPHLIVSLKPDGPINTKELFVQTVCAGRPAKGMPAWCALGLDMNKINDIYLYVKGRSDAKISPGRPAVKPEG
jgi:cytochrome c